MVDLKLKYELNDILPMRIQNTEVPIGDDDSSTVGQLVLFDRNIVKSQDLDRYPVLRSIMASWQFDGSLLADMLASAIGGMSVQFSLYNGRSILSEKFYEINGFIFQNAAVAGLIWMPSSSWDHEGGLLLSPEITFELLLDLDGVVAGADFEAANLSMDAFLEIDWTPISAKQLTEIIQETVYAEQ